MTGMQPLSEGQIDQMELQIAAVSKWVDDANQPPTRAPEALTWHRVAKVAEEAGEVIEEMIAYVGGNPRKGTVDHYAQGDESPMLVKELLDVAMSALGAVEHLTGNRGTALRRLAGHVDGVYERTGVRTL